MKMYKVFEMMGFKFEHGGGCFIKVYDLSSDTGLEEDTIEEYHTVSDRDMAERCLEWLENRGIIDDVSPYLSWNEPEKKSDRRQDLLTVEDILAEES